jgi:hypothetical protein
MSESRSRERSVNWRGPLLAAAIFAGVFGILLLMARLNQSKTSDEGSSFRQDPYGASLLFDSYERAGYEVRRSQDEKSLAEQDASRTTAFFVGGYSERDFETKDTRITVGRKFHSLLDEFLERGGRVVLLEHDSVVRFATITESDEKQRPSAPKWENEKTWAVENENDWSGKQAGPTWARPNLPGMPQGSEMMYLSAEVPWLKTDAEWTPLYVGPVNAMGASLPDGKNEAKSSPHVYMAIRKVGSGELLAASQESFLLNEAIKTHPNPVLLDFLTEGRPVIWVDETLHGLHQEEGVLWLVQRYRLQAALLLFWATLLVLLWSIGGDLVRRPASDRSAEVIRHGEAAGLAAQRLLQRSIAIEQVVMECWDQFRRRSPQDAQAISADRTWSPQLRKALAQGPLAGYKELSRLIAERRASARGLGRAHSEAPRQDPISPKTTPEEARIA